MKKDYNNILVNESFNEDKSIALISLNRPQALNALSTELMNELLLCLKELDQNNQTKVIILTGSDRAFAAGADIKEMSDASPIDMIVERRFQAWDEMKNIKKPIIAAVNGFALGGGCELAMACDFIVAGDTAVFGQPEVTIGTIPGAGGTQRLTNAIGKSKAMYHILTGENFTAQQAYEWGLVAKVVPSKCLMDEVFEITKNIAKKSSLAIALAKESVNNSFNQNLHDGLESERKNFFLTFSSHDQKEGMNAFVEKRKANYLGK